MLPEPSYTEGKTIEVEEGEIINFSFEYFTSNYGDELEEVWWILGNYETNEIKFLCSTAAPTLNYTVPNNLSQFLIYPIVIMKSGDACGPALENQPFFEGWHFAVSGKSIPGGKS